jgi:hypothetical protein
MRFRGSSNFESAMHVAVAAVATMGRVLLLPAATALAQNWEPRCTSQKSENCYWWLTNPNGTISHIYQGGKPNCQKGPPGGYDPSANPTCEQPGNGGPESPAPQQQPLKGHLSKKETWQQWCQDWDKRFQGIYQDVANSVQWASTARGRTQSES